MEWAEETYPEGGGDEALGEVDFTRWSGHDERSVVGAMRCALDGWGMGRRQGSVVRRVHLLGAAVRQCLCRLPSGRVCSR